MDEADQHLQKLEKRYSVEEHLRQAMDMKTTFSPNQLNFIKTWTEEWGFSEDMIILAYQITLDNKGSLNFNYTTDDAKRSSEEFRGKRRRKPEESGNSSIDMDDVMDELRRQYQ